MVYKTRGVCSREIHFDVTDHKLTNVQYIGGCSGNTQGIARLVEGMDISDVIRRLEGTRCGFKPNNKPQWISLCPEESIHVEFLVFTKNSEAAFKAVKNSTLPQDVIDYLTEDGTFEGVLTRGGFSVYSNPYFEDTEIEGLSFKEVLGKYNEDFLKIIAPFVPPDSYIEIETKDNLLYRWKFDGSTCKKIYQKIVWE